MDGETSHIDPFPLNLARWASVITLIFAALLFAVHGGADVRTSMADIKTLSLPQLLPGKRSSSHARINLIPAQEEEEQGLYHAIIVQAATRHQVDPALVKAIIMAESGYNPRAISKSGAKGLMQLMPRTAEAMGIEDIFDPEHNINAGVKYFKKLLNQFEGNLKLALAAYNAGSRKVREYQGIPPFKATRYYVDKVIQYYHKYKERMNGEMGNA
jgi:soluble lytic murein transglycosylase-like protein